VRWFERFRFSSPTSLAFLPQIRKSGDGQMPTIAESVENQAFQCLKRNRCTFRLLVEERTDLDYSPQLTPQRTLLTMKEAMIATPTPSRFTIATAILFFAISPTMQRGYAQQVTSDVAISGAGLNDGYVNGGQCDSEGQLYRRSNGRGAQSVMRVARDGSTVIFATPETEGLLLVAPDSLGVTLLSVSPPRSQVVPRHLYRFDRQANLVSQREVTLDFNPLNMAVTSSGKIIVVGYRTQDQDKNPVGAVLDADGQVAHLLEFPIAAMTNGDWTPSKMTASDGVAYFIPYSQTGPIYSITESGRIDVIHVAPVGDHLFDKWLFGSGVAVEEYVAPAEKLSRGIWFDIYDLATGKKIGSKSLLRAMGGTTACYLGDEVSWLAHSQGLQELRLVTVKLKNNN
jgi:hypothetical protein